MCRRSLPLVFVGWTIFVWGNRIANILDDGRAQSATRTSSLGLAVAIVALSVFVALADLRGGRPSWPLPTLALVTTAVWALRVPLIVFNADHGVGFKVVHAVLGAVSIALGSAAWKAVRPRPGFQVSSGSRSLRSSR